MPLNEIVEEGLCALGLYRPLRDAYQQLFNRRFYERRLQARRLYRSFVPQGGLVFDVGANHGRYCEIFLELGARVVAVEPNPACARKIRRRHGCSRVVIEEVAAGAEPGRAQLHLGREDGHSTLSDEWTRIIASKPEMGTERWIGRIETRVVTVDELIRAHGRPDFLKIDVEGFEPAVLRGLRSLIPTTSFEYQCAAPELARECLDLLAKLGATRFNLTFVQEAALKLRDWTDREGIAGTLQDLAHRHSTAYGDVFAQ